MDYDIERKDVAWLSSIPTAQPPSLHIRQPNLVERRGNEWYIPPKPVQYFYAFQCTQNRPFGLVVEVTPCKVLRSDTVLDLGYVWMNI